MKLIYLNLVLIFVFLYLCILNIVIYFLFISSLIQILDEKCEFERQTILLSATLTPAVERLAGLTLRNPVYVDVTPEAMSEIDRITMLSVRLIM